MRGFIQIYKIYNVSFILLPIHLLYFQLATSPISGIRQSVVEQRKRVELKMGRRDKIYTVSWKRCCLFIFHALWLSYSLRFRVSINLYNQNQ